MKLRAITGGLRLALLLALTALGTAAAPALAAPVQYFPESGARVSDTSLAVAPDGTVTAAWIAHEGDAPSELRFAQFGTGPVEVRTVPGPAAHRKVDLAVDDAGRATVVWDTIRGLNAARIEPGGEIVTADLRNGVSPDVEVDRSGAATIVYLNRRGLVATRLDPDLVQGGVKTINPGYGGAFDVGIDDGGRATVALATGKGRRFSRVLRIVRIGAGPSLRTDELLKRKRQRNFSIQDPAVAVTGKGQATVVWNEDRSGRSTILATHISAEGEVGGVRDVTNGANRVAAEPQVAMLPSGTATVTWSSRPKDSHGDESQILFARLDRRGVPDRAHQISGSSGTDAREPVVAAAPNDRFFIAWRHAAKGSGADATCVTTLRLDLAPAHIGPALKIPGSCPASHGPQLAIGSGGQPSLSWTGNGVHVLAPGTG